MKDSQISWLWPIWSDWVYNKLPMPCLWNKGKNIIRLFLTLTTKSLWIYQHKRHSTEQKIILQSKIWGIQSHWYMVMSHSNIRWQQQVTEKPDFGKGSFESWLRITFIKGDFSPGMEDELTAESKSAHCPASLLTVTPTMYVVSYCLVQGTMYNQYLRKEQMRKYKITEYWIKKYYLYAGS